MKVNIVIRTSFSFKEKDNRPNNTPTFVNIGTQTLTDTGPTHERGPTYPTDWRDSDQRNGRFAPRFSRMGCVSLLVCVITWNLSGTCPLTDMSSHLRLIVPDRDVVVIADGRRIYEDRLKILVVASLFMKPSIFSSFTLSTKVSLVSCNNYCKEP